MGYLLALFSQASSSPTGPFPDTASVWKQFIGIGLDGWAIQIKIGPVIYILAVLAVLFLIWWNRRTLPTLFRQFEMVEAETTIFGLPKFTVRANRENVRIAYEAWIELITRKAGLPFDEEHDTIVEVYNSWYELFSKLRSLAKTVPAHRLATCPDSQRLVEIMVEVLNVGIRPHLTKWQAKFRRWYDKRASDEPDKAPQAIQREYPDYEALIADLKQVNQGIVVYTNWLRKVAGGEKLSAKTA